MIDVCALVDIPALGARRVRRSDGVEIAVFRTAADAVFALLDRCPHKGGPLSQGIVFGDRVACPLHNWSIALDSGRAVAPDVGCTQRFAVSVVDGRVLLDPWTGDPPQSGTVGNCSDAASSAARD
jgi:nitrite reductase (NADH) small subunit